MTHYFRQVLERSSKILTVTEYSWIISEANKCIRRGVHAPHCATIVGEEEIFHRLIQEASRCKFDDFWRIKVGDVSLFYYNATLLTWFSGLNLVRFEYTPRAGRRLCII